MSITPTGYPVWVRANGHTAYGGHINKTNYQSVGTVNPRTDLSAENLCRIAADLAAVARTAPFSVCTFQCSDAVPAAPTLSTYYAMAGNQPTATRNGNGDVSFLWQDSYADDYGVIANANIVAAVGMVLTPAATPGYVTTEISDADADGVNDTVRVRVFDENGMAVSNAVVSLITWTG